MSIKNTLFRKLRVSPIWLSAVGLAFGGLPAGVAASDTPNTDRTGDP